MQGPVGRPRYRPEEFMGDRAYGSACNISKTRDRGIRSRLAPLRAEHGSGLGVFRYVVERSLSWFNHFRRLRLCYEKSGKHFQAFHDLAAAMICARKLGSLQEGF